MPKKPLNPQSSEPSSYESFEELTKRLMAVPKKDLDKKLATYNAKKVARQVKKTDK